MTKERWSMVCSVIANFFIHRLRYLTRYTGSNLATFFRFLSSKIASPDPAGAREIAMLVAFIHLHLMC